MGEVILFFLLASVGLGHCSEDNASVNIATRGRATQSSTFEVEGCAKHAIDGSRNSDYNKNSCTKTDGRTNSWWRVDLLDTYEVSSVTVTNRDQLPERINRAEIRIGNSLENDGNSNPRCAVISSIPAGGSTTFQCQGMQGRYVNVFLPGYKQYLTLCEVEVYAIPLHSVGPAQTPELDLAVPVTENVALGKTAVLSSEYNSNRRASKAIDGENNYNNGYSRTKTQTNPWWRVDLLQAYNITSITIVNIEDDNPEMIDGAEIRIGNSLENNGNSNPLCAVISSYPAWRVKIFQCRRMEGRYVNIFLPGCGKHLALCEVEVNVGGDKENDKRVLTSSTADSETRAQVLLRRQDDIVCPNYKNKDKTIQENASTGGIAAQSSQWDKDGAASNAIDQDRKNMYTSGSCSHTKAEIDPWWQVDLKKTYNVTFVTVTNRGDCCSERISGAEIHVGHSLINNGNSNPICAVIPYIPLGQTRTFPCGGMEGQYVNILLPGREKYLTLCEVEVHASNFIREYPPPTQTPPTNPYLAWLWEPLRQLRHPLILKE
ncbi:uncharacterized protein LOC134023818 [Osmerus eperlanus]|uniref:uncharacterized protein LOC134023818 n=1 Tax=Osmerus eperlanus TaxID=29151 RepID=UPI002E15D0F4